MSVVRWLEVVGLVVFFGGIVVLVVRGLLYRSPAQKYRTGYYLALSWIVAAPVLAVVYALSALGVAETFLGGENSRRGPWFIVVACVVLTALLPGSLRRTRKGMAEHS